jgi:hypothetical protein
VRKHYLPLLLLLLLTLPFRGMAALGMFPGEMGAPAASMAAGELHDCAHMQDAADPKVADHTCSFCADCCSMAMTGPVALVVPVADFHTPSDSLSPARYAGFEPDGLERPPRHAPL